MQKIEREAQSRREIEREAEEQAGGKETEIDLTRRTLSSETKVDNGETSAKLALSGIVIPEDIELTVEIEEGEEEEEDEHEKGGKERRGSKIWEGLSAIAKSASWRSEGSEGSRAESEADEADEANRAQVTRRMRALSTERLASLWRREAQDRSLLAKTVGWDGLALPRQEQLAYAGPALRLLDDLEASARAQEFGVQRGVSAQCPKLEWVTVVRDEVEGKMVLAMMGEGDDDDFA